VSQVPGKVVTWCKVRPDYSIDGVYLEPALAQSWPTDGRVVPFVVNGQFKTERPCGELDPVVWLMMQRYGRPMRGACGRSRTVHRRRSYYRG
jgi:hypothetical protein